MNNLRNNLIELYEEQEKLLKEKYDRSLSFQDGLIDRFTRAQRLGFGKGASIYNSATLFGKVEAGEKTWIGPYVILDGSGGAITIGDYCSISSGVHIYTHDSVLWSLSGGKCKANKGSVFIGSNTYIGAQSIVKAGVSIGSNSVVGANTFVNSNVEDFTIVAGSPARQIGSVVISNDEISLVYNK